MGNTSMNKDDLITMFEAERQRFDAALARLSDTEMERIPLEDDWTAKDLIAHITAWELRLLEWLDAAERGISPALPAPGAWGTYMDIVNAETYECNRARSLDAIRQEYDTVYRALLERLNALPDRDDDPRWAPWLDGLPPWGLLLTFPAHYRHHRKAIMRWILRRASLGI